MMKASSLVVLSTVEANTEIATKVNTANKYYGSEAVKTSILSKCYCGNDSKVAYKA